MRVDRTTVEGGSGGVYGGEAFKLSVRMRAFGVVIVVFAAVFVVVEHGRGGRFLPGPGDAASEREVGVPLALWCGRHVYATPGRSVPATSDAASAESH